MSPQNLSTAKNKIDKDQANVSNLVNPKEINDNQYGLNRITNSILIFLIFLICLNFFINSIENYICFLPRHKMILNSIYTSIKEIIKKNFNKPEMDQILLTF